MKCAANVMPQDEGHRLMLRNVRLQKNKWEIRAFLEGIGLQPIDIQCCRLDKVITPRHQTVFCELQSDTWLMQNGLVKHVTYGCNQKCYMGFHQFKKENTSHQKCYLSFNAMRNMPG